MGVNWNGLPILEREIMNPDEMLASILKAHQMKKKPPKSNKKAVAKTETSQIEAHGKALESLGKALQDPDSKVRDLAALAYQCGLTLNFGFKRIEKAI